MYCRFYAFASQQTPKPCARRTMCTNCSPGCVRVCHKSQETRKTYDSSARHAPRNVPETVKPQTRDTVRPARTVHTAGVRLYLRDSYGFTLPLRRHETGPHIQATSTTHKRSTFESALRSDSIASRAESRMMMCHFTFVSTVRYTVPFYLCYCIKPYAL